MGSPVLGSVRLAVYLLLTLTLVPIQMALVALKARGRAALPRFYHRLCARVLGIEVETVGRPARERSALYVANHSSYLDIIVLGGLIHGAFVAKSEVAGWPFFGFLARLQSTVFVDRRTRNAASHRDDLKARLEAGGSLILFPEGTSSDGNRVLPFKSTLFGAAAVRSDGRPVTVQPVSIVATHLDGMPLGRSLRPLYAWYGDMELAGHVWRFAKLGRTRVRVAFHAPVTLERFGSRKALAEHCRRVVATGVDEAVSGRPPRAEGEVAVPVDAAPPDGRTTG